MFWRASYTNTLQPNDHVYILQVSVFLLRGNDFVIEQQKPTVSCEKLDPLFFLNNSLNI